MTAPRSRRTPGFLVAVILWAAWGTAHGETPLGVVETATTLSAEAASGLVDFVKELREAKETLWTERMEAEILEMTNTLHLSRQEQEALKAQVAPIVQPGLDPWSGRAEAMLRVIFERQPHRLAEYRTMTDTYAQEGVFPEEPHLVDQEAWGKAWRAALTPAHAQLWEKTLAERADKEGGDLQRSLTAMSDAAHEVFNGAMATPLEEIKETLVLSPERAEALDAVGARAVERSMAIWTASARLELKDMLKQGQALGDFELLAESKEMPDLQPVWHEGLSRLLSVGELQRMEEIRAEHVARRVRATAQVFLLFLDDKLALTVAQRAGLQPIAEKLVQKGDLLQGPQNGEESTPPAAYLAAGEQAPEGEVRALISEAQWKRWQKVCVAIQPSAPPPEAPAAPRADSEAVEQAISQFLADRAARERERISAPLLLQAEDAARALLLPREICARLQTGARGATERAMRTWLTQDEELIRTNLVGITPQNLAQRLTNLAEVRGAQDEAPQREFWQKCLEKELSAEQRARWQKEIEARREFRDRTVIGALLAELDRKLPLGSEQWQKLGAMVSRLVAQHRATLANFFSSEDEEAWYQSPSTRYMLLAGLDQSEVQALLGRDRWKRWAANDVFTSAQDEWKNFKQESQNRRP